MKKEFGKWFLDLAKYILTAILLTAFLGEVERAVVLWGALVLFLVSIIIGYLLLVQSDKDKSSVQELSILPTKQTENLGTELIEQKKCIKQ